MPESIYTRNWGRTIAGLAVALVIGGVFGDGMFTNPSRDTVVGVTIVEALTVIAVVRTWRAGVLVTDERIVIRNLLSSRSAPWSRVAAFSPAWDDPRHHSVGVLTLDGRRISCDALRDMGGWAMFSMQRSIASAAQNVPASRVAEQVERMLARRSVEDARSGQRLSQPTDQN